MAYYGDVSAAARDLLGAARERSDPALSPELRASPPPAWASHPWMISSIYLFVLSGREIHFGFTLGHVLLAALAALVVLRGMRIPVPGTRRQLSVDSSTRPAWAVVAAVIVSCAWISVMPGHAHMHPNFIPRHLFLLWLVIVLALLRAVRFEEQTSNDRKALGSALALALPLFVCAFLLRIANFGLVFAGGRVRFPSGRDELYHVRKIVYQVLRFPEVLDFDPYVSFPFGAHPVWPPYFDWLVAALLRPFAGGDAASVERLVVWLRRCSAPPRSS